MKYQQVITIIRRDTLLLVRTSWLFLPLAIFNLLMMQFVSMNDVLRLETSPAQQNEILKGLVGYAPMMVIPFVGNVILNKTMVEERTRRTLVRTLVTGIDPATLWIAKFLSAFCISLLILIVSLVAVWGLIFFRTRVFLHLDFSDSLLLLVVNPLLAFAMLAIMGVVYWLMKKPSTGIMFVPIILTFGSWSLAAVRPLITLFSTETAWIITLTSVLIIVLCTVVSSRFSRERITGFY